MHRIGFAVSYQIAFASLSAFLALCCSRPQDDHELVVLELFGPADVAEMGDVG